MKFSNVFVSECPTTSTPGDGGAGDVQSLILKPGIHVACAGELQFSAYLSTSNSGETLLTEGVTFVSSSPAVVAIDSTTGAATLLTAGVATITASFGSLFATSQVTVMGEGDSCCDDVTVATMVAIDNSKSMSLPVYGAGSRLDFANLAANTLFEAMRWDKDIAGLLKFSSGPTLINSISSTQPTAAVTQTTEQTDIEEALEGAIAELDGVTADRKVLVIISDGQHRPTASTPPESTSGAIAKAAAFKNGGGVIIAVGASATGDGFSLLQSIASGGFFLNAFDADTVAAALSYLTGFLCYYCGGLPPSYGYCLTEPPQEQLPATDTNPDTEITATSQQWTATKQVCVACGSSNESEQNLVPLMTADDAPSGEAFASGGETASGGEAFRAFDQDPSTWWQITGAVTGVIGYRFDVGQVITSYRLGVRSDTVISSPGEWTFEGSNDGSTWTVLDSRIVSWVAGQSQLFTFANSTSYTYYRLNISRAYSASGTQNVSLATFEMYGIPPLIQCASATRVSYVSQEDANELATAAATAAATALCDVPNNDLTVQFNNGTLAPANRYPSWKLVEDMTGVVTDVTVTLNNVSHRAPEAVALVLEAPDGTAVLLWNHTGNGARYFSGVEVVIDDAASDVIPMASGSGAIPAGSYKPTVTSGRETEQFPGVAPIQPYGVALSDFAGVDPNGRWKLWAMHRQFYTVFDPIYARLVDGWDLDITTA